MTRGDWIALLSKRVLTLVQQGRDGDWDGRGDALYYRLNDVIWFYKEGGTWKQGDTGDPVGWEGDPARDALDDLQRRALSLRAEAARQALDREILARTE